MRNTVQRHRSQTKELQRYSFAPSATVRKHRDRRNAARFSMRALRGVTALSADPYVSPQELSALRNEEDGGCVGRVLNLLRIMGERRDELVAFIASESRLMGARMPIDALREAFTALDIEEDADAADCIPQQEFNRNPNKQTSRVLREHLEAQHAATAKAIDALKAFEDSQENVQ